MGNWRRKILDRLCLIPSRDPLDSGGQVRDWIEIPGGRVECFWQSKPARAAVDAAHEPLRASERPTHLPATPRTDGVIIKWAGNAGRAEQSSTHPATAWPDLNLEVVTINPPGYGQSPGPASLSHVPEMATAVWRYVGQRFPGVPAMVFGNSIGSLTAMHVALSAQAEGADRLVGLILRNPPPLPQLIRGHYQRWYHGPVPRWLVAAWGPEMDATALAPHLNVPMLMIQAEFDTIVPPAYQDLIFRAYRGPAERWVLREAGHEDLPGPEDPVNYRAYLDAIRRVIQWPQRAHS